MLTCELLQLRREAGPGLLTGPRHDVSDRLDKAILILPPGDAACMNSGMLEEEMFDLRRTHPDAAHLEHVV